MSVFGGIVEKSGSGGSTGNWQKNNVDRITAACIGAGGGGFRDDDGDEDGGGGGGGGKAAGYADISVGETITWRQAQKSPRRTSSKGGNAGISSFVRRSTGSNIALATGGETGTDNSGGGGGGSGTGNLETAGGNSGSDDDAGQDGGGAAGCGGCGDGKGGKGATISWSGDSPSFGCTGCPGGIDANSFGGGGAGNNDDGDSGSGGEGYAGWAWYWADPVINSVTVTNQENLNPTQSGGIQNTPSDVVNIAWDTSYADKVEVKKSGVVYHTDNNGGGGNTNISTGLQSNANGTSPATKTYNVVAYGYGGTFTSTTVTVSVKNDWTPTTTNAVISKTESELEPSQTATINIGTVSGVDMPVWGYITASGGSLGKTNTNSSNPWLFYPGDNIYVTLPMPYYEVDITGRTSNTTGNIASRTFTMYLGSKNFNVTWNVKRPVIDENFDFGNQTGYVPNPDIDLINPDPISYMVTNSVECNEIELSRGQITSNIGSGEISTEIKSDNPDIQISINNDTWQYVREI